MSEPHWWVEVRYMDDCKARREGYVPVYGPFKTQEEASEWRFWVENEIYGPPSRTKFLPDVV